MKLVGENDLEAVLLGLLCGIVAFIIGIGAVLQYTEYVHGCSTKCPVTEYRDVPFERKIKPLPREKGWEDTLEPTLEVS